MAKGWRIAPEPTRIRSDNGTSLVVAAGLERTRPGKATVPDGRFMLWAGEVVLAVNSENTIYDLARDEGRKWAWVRYRSLDDRSIRWFHDVGNSFGSLVGQP